MRLLSSPSATTTRHHCKAIVVNLASTQSAAMDEDSSVPVAVAWVLVLVLVLVLGRPPSPCHHHHHHHHPVQTPNLIDKEL